MQFRCCCTCDDDEKTNKVESGNTFGDNANTPPKAPVVTEQPKPGPFEFVQFNKITEDSVKNSFVPEDELEMVQTPVALPRTTNVNANADETDHVKQSISGQPSSNSVPSPTSPQPLDSSPVYREFIKRLNQVKNQPYAQDAQFDSSKSDLNFSTNVGENLLTYDRIAPGRFAGTYKGSHFTILDGQLQSTDGVYTCADKEMILQVYAEAMAEIERNVNVNADQPVPRPTSPQPLVDNSPVYQELIKRLNQVKNNSYARGAQFDSSKSDFNFSTNVGENLLRYEKIAPGRFAGTYKGSKFTILNGQLQSTDGVYTCADREMILKVYAEAMAGMERGMKGMQAGLMGYVPGQQTELPAGSDVHVNFMGNDGEPAQITFTLIQPGHFRGVYNGKEFSILNGQVLTSDGYGNDVDKELILMYFNKSMLGMQKGMMGMQRGMAAFKTDLSRTNVGLLGTNFTGINNQQDLAMGQETLKRMRYLNLGKRISILDAEAVTRPSEPAVVKEDIHNKPNKTFLSDGVLTEPVLQKTTFTPTAIIYEDPKTYEKQDNNELPLAKRLDEYIISLDETDKAGNKYYFHSAKPRRVPKKQLSRIEKLELAAPDRYALYESESLKAHNEFRKMHGVAPLVNNEFLCQVAREWAQHLALKDAFYHRPKNEYGENLYYSDGMLVCARNAVKAWYDEIDLYDYNNPGFSKETGHFTQLVWKDTREVGTGVAQIGDKLWVCCNYHPPGNYGGKFNDEFVPRPVVIKRVKGV